MHNTQILYLEAEKRDFYNNFQQHNPGYFLRDSDGRLDHQRRPHPDPPWYYTKPVATQNCHFYHKVLFNVVFEKKKVPIHCQTSCWKVVVGPRNLEEAIWTYLLQRQLDLPSKVGSEIARRNSNKMWGAYWYNITRQEGMDRYQQIKALYTNADTQRGIILGCPIEVNLLTKGEAKEKGFPLEVPIILKRACTEFEQHCGSSLDWSWDAVQHDQEIHARDAFVPDMQNFVQGEQQRGTLFMKWIHDAYRVGDDSYLKFTNYNPLFDPCDTIHDRPDWRPDFPDLETMTEKQEEKEGEKNGKERE